MITKTKTHTYTTFDWLPASLLQLYRIWNSVKCWCKWLLSPRIFFKKKLESSPFLPLPKQLPSGLINKWSSYWIRWTFKKKRDQHQTPPSPPLQRSCNLPPPQPHPPTTFSTKKGLPIIPTSRKQDRAKSKAPPSRPKFQGNQKPSLLSFQFGCLFRWLYRQQRIIITRVRASQAMLRTRRSKIILHIQV